jgi:uncharacterized membrane protein YccC
MGCLVAIVVAFIAFLMFGIVVTAIQNPWPLTGCVVIIWAIRMVWVYYFKEKE